MSEYNIQMNKYNALNAEYDQLYPQPMKHASTHAKDGDDPITPSSIGAAELGADGKVLTSQLPSMEIDAYTKVQTLSDTTKTLFGLDATAVPDDALALLSRFQNGLGNEYVWGKTKVVVTPAYATEEAVSGAQRVLYYGSSVTFHIADSFSVSDDGTVSLDNPEIVEVPRSGDQVTPTKRIIGKYFLISGDGNTQFYGGAFYYNTIYYCPSDATIQQSDYDSHYGGYFGLIVGTVNKIVGHAKEIETTFVGYVNSPDHNAYPPAVSDGYTYTPFGPLGGFSKIATGNYMGTGTYGVSNPNSLTFDFEPKVVFIEADATATAGFAWIYGNSYGISVRGSSTYDNMLTWGSNSLSWYCTKDNYGQLNVSNTKYRYIAIG